MRIFLKLILSTFIFIFFYSCNSSNSDDHNYVYRSLKNFSLRIELGSHTAVYGEMIWVKISIKNNSDEKDSIAYFYELMRAPVIVQGSVKDTTWKCAIHHSFETVIDYIGGVPYKVFNPGEEKSVYAYFGRNDYYCWNDTMDVYYTHFLIPDKYKISAHVSKSAKEFLNSNDTLNFTILEVNPEASQDLIIDRQDKGKFKNEISTDSINNFYEEKMMKYKNTVYEIEFFIRKIEFNLNRNCIECKKDLINKIEYYIDKNPDLSQNYTMLHYYKSFRMSSLNDTTGTNNYFLNLQQKYPQKRISEFVTDVKARGY